MVATMQKHPSFVIIGQRFSTYVVGTLFRSFLNHESLFFPHSHTKNIGIDVFFECTFACFNYYISQQISEMFYPTF